MHKATYLALLSLFLFVTPAAAESLAIVNVNVVPMTGETVKRAQTVLIDGDRITAIGDVDDVPVAEGVELIDGTDRLHASTR